MSLKEQMAYKGTFRARNPHKYKGDPTNIIYRSRWELVVMQKLDDHPDVLEWSSEEIIVKYLSPLDRKVHRYFPDFWVKQKNRGGALECNLIEVKPFNQTKPPRIIENKHKPTRRYLNEVATWGINSAKWTAAREYCKDRGWNFIIITERELGLKF